MELANSEVVGVFRTVRMWTEYPCLLVISWSKFAFFVLAAYYGLACQERAVLLNDVHAFEVLLLVIVVAFDDVF